MAYFRTFSEVRNRSLTAEKVRLFYMETYLLRKCVLCCNLGLDNANLACGLDVNGMRKIHEQFSVDLAIFGYGFLEN